MNKLYYGDNLEVLREKILDNSVDLIYLDPPFQSGKNYNIIFDKNKFTIFQADQTCIKDLKEQIKGR